MTALVLGLMLLAFAASRPKGPHKLSELPPEAQATFNVVNGRLHYKAPVANLIITSLISRVAFPTDVPNVVMVQPGDAPVMGADQWGAYFVLQALHAEGSSIWVPTNMHIPTGAPQPVLFLEPGQTPPEQGYALLIAAAQPWPTLPLA